MTFEERWRAELDTSLATFAALAAQERTVDFTHGYLAASVLWPVRQAVRQRHDEAIDCLTDLAPTAYRELRQLIDGWPEEERAAAQALAAAAAGSQKLRKGLDALIAHFDAATTFSRYLQPHVVSEGGQKFDIDEIKAMLVNVGGIMSIQSLVIHSQQAAPKLDEDYAGAYIAARVDEHIARYTALAFVGRSDEQRVLDDVAAKGGRLVVTAPAGFGKSALFAHWLRQQQNAFVAYHFFSDRFDEGRSIQKGLHNIVRQLCHYYGLGKEKLPRADASKDGLRAALVGLLQDHGALPDQPLIILLDALDEAEAPFTPPFPGALPDGVSLIVSGRAEENETPPHLAGWVDDARRLHLEKLPLPAVAAWLHEAGSGALAHWAQKAEFVQEVNQKTQGFPLYLSFLIEDLLGVVEVGADPVAVLQGTPTGFSSYVRQQFQKLAKTARQEQQIADLFVLLAVAKGPLLEQEVAALTNLSEWDLADLPHEVTRWFNVVPLGRGSLSGTRTFAFAHALLAEEFKQLLSNRAQIIEEQLLEWCARWPEHREQYALQYYPLHLVSDRYEQLYALARNESYLHLQSQLEANLPLRTLQIALETATARDAVQDMADFLLRYAKWVQQTATRESPLLTTRNGDPERAFQLADLYPPADRILWYLIICWELTDAGHLNTAAAALERLLQTDLPILTEVDWRAQAAITITPYLIAKEPAGIVASIVTILIQRLIDSHALDRLVNALVQRRLFSAAWQISYSILNPAQRAKVLRKIVTAQAQANDMDAALETVAQIEDDSQRAWALREIAAAQAYTGDIDAARYTFERALETATQIEDGWQRAEALRELAAAQAHAGNIDAAHYTFERALETAAQIESDCHRVEALRELAVAQAYTGDIDAARYTFERALETATQIEDGWQRAEALRELAAAQAHAGNIDAALETTAQIESDWRRVEALREIAAAQVHTGNIDAVRHTLARALETAAQMEDGWYWARTLQEIAVTQAHAGNIDVALEIAAQIEGGWQRAEALREIAAAQVHAGDIDAALETAAQIEDGSQRTKALREIAAAQVHAGDIDAARHTFERALETAAQIEDGWHRTWAPQEIATAQAYTGDIDAARHTLARALETAAQIESNWQRAEALREIATAQAHAGNIDAARHTFERALEAAAQIESNWQRAEALREIATAQAHAGDIDAARHTFERALETAAQIKEGLQRAEALQEIAAAQAHAGNFDVALEIAAQIERVWDRAGALQEIAVAQTHAGNIDAARHTFEQALETVAQVEGVWQWGWALQEIAAAQVQAGDIDAALETAEQIEGNWQRAGALREIAVAQAHAGNIDAALEIATQIENGRERAGALREIAAAQAHADNIDAALETATHIEENLQRAEALQKIATAQAHAGNIDAAHNTFERALETAKQIEGIWYRARTLREIAAAHAHAGDIDVALEVATQIEDNWERAEALREIAVAQTVADFGSGAVTTSTLIITGQNVHLPIIAAALAEAGDKENFKRLLIPCAYYLDAAYRMCGSLTTLYPEQAGAIAAIVIGNVDESAAG